MARGMRLSLAFTIPKRGAPEDSEVRIAAFSSKTDRDQWLTPDEAECELDEFVAITRRTIAALRKEQSR